jgi:hypothetical protein
MRECEKGKRKQDIERKREISDRDRDNREAEKVT